MKLLWKEKKKECDTEQQGACLKTQFKPPTVVQFSCAGRGSSSSWIQATKRAWQNHRLDFSAKGSAEADLLAWHPFPWQQQIELSCLPCGGDKLQKSRSWSCRAAEHLEQMRMSSCTSDFHGVSSAAGASAQGQDAGRGEVGMELLRTKQARKQSWEANISSRTSWCVLIFFSLLPCSFYLIILHLHSLLFDAAGSICGSSSICGTGQAAHQRCWAGHTILTGLYWYPVLEALLM